MTKAIKFDEADREATIREVQNCLGVQLSPVGRRRKWLRDNDGRSYWVIGGYGDWHGIPEDMFDAEAQAPTEGILIFANRRREALQVFLGPLEPLVRNRSKLYRARKTTGEFQFTLTQKGARLHVNQVPGFALKELSTFGYTAEEKAKDQSVHAVKGLLRKLSKEQISSTTARVRPLPPERACARNGSARRRAPPAREQAAVLRRSEPMSVGG